MSTLKLISDAAALDLHVKQITSAGQRPASIRARRETIQRLGRHLDPDGANPRVVIEATAAELARWQASCAHLAAKSISVYVTHVQEFYRWLVRPMRVLVESPAEDLIKPIVRRRFPRPISEEDLRVALDACTDDRMRAWLILGAYAGLRAGDMADLRADDLLTDREMPMLRVRGKGDHENLVIVGHEVINALVPFLGRRGPLFVDQTGRRATGSTVSVAVNKHLARLGLPYTCHQLRHRYGTKLYELTRDIRFTQKQMRHSSVASTEGYVQVPTDQGVQAAEALDRELRPNARRPAARGHLRSVGGPS